MLLLFKWLSCNDIKSICIGSICTHQARWGYGLTKGTTVGNSREAPVRSASNSIIHFPCAIHNPSPHTNIYLFTSCCPHMSLSPCKRPDWPTNVPCQPSNNPDAAETRLFQFSVVRHWGSKERVPGGSALSQCAPTHTYTHILFKVENLVPRTGCPLGSGVFQCEINSTVGYNVPYLLIVTVSIDRSWRALWEVTCNRDDMRSNKKSSKT